MYLLEQCIHFFYFQNFAHTSFQARSLSMYMIYWLFNDALAVKGMQAYLPLTVLRVCNFADNANQDSEGISTSSSEWIIYFDFIHIVGLRHHFIYFDWCFNVRAFAKPCKQRESTYPRYCPSEVRWCNSSVGLNPKNLAWRDFIMCREWSLGVYIGTG